MDMTIKMFEQQILLQVLSQILFPFSMEQGGKKKELKFGVIYLLTLKKPLAFWSLSCPICNMGTAVPSLTTSQGHCITQQNVQKYFVELCKCLIWLLLLPRYRFVLYETKSYVERFQTIKNIPEAETISRLHLSANA